MTFTTAEKIANVERTIAATEGHIAELTETNRLNKGELSKLRTILREEERVAAMYNSDESRWKRAAKALRKEGIKFRTNVSACCRGCVGNEKLNLAEDDTTTPYAWTFGGQGRAIKWDGAGNAIEKLDRWVRVAPPVVAYINHGNDSAARVVAALKAEGLTVVWDGKDFSCIEVHFGK